MKKRFTIIIMLIILLQALLTTIVNAADATVSLTADKQSAKAGDTVTVKLNVKCEQGIEDVDINLDYDKNKLELESSTPNNQFDKLTEGSTFSIFPNTGTKITDADVITFIFKLKSGVEKGTTTVTLSNIKVENGNDETITIADKAVDISIVESGSEQPDNPTPSTATLKSIKVTTQPTKKSYTEGDKFDPTGMVVMAEYSDGTTKTITGYTVTDGGKLVKGQTTVTISYKDGDVTKTTTQAITVSEYKAQSGNGSSAGSSNNGGVAKTTTDTSASEKEIPKTGLASIVLPAIVLGIIAGISYIAYKKSNV